MNQDTGFSIVAAFLELADFGAEWVMYLMIALGLLGMGLFLERLILYLRTQIDAPALARDLVKHLSESRLDKAINRVRRGRTMEERVLADALESFGQGASVTEQIFMSSLARERQRFERFLGYFGTLGNNAPFIGLLGTVIGIILAFKELGENPKGGLEVVGPGIAEALVATAVGLFVAIPAVVCFNGFKGALKKRVSNTEFLGRIVMAQAERAQEEQAQAQEGAG